MKIEVDINYSRILTDNSLLLAKLIELYSFTDPKSFYVKNRYAKNKKKQFISENGKFLTGLLPRILEDLKLIDCYPDIEYLTKLPTLPCSSNYDVGEYKLYDFQKESIDRILSRKRGIIKLPTGAGKSVIICALINYFKDKKCLILVPNKSLVVQLYEDIKKCGIECGINFGEGFIISNIMVSTIQSVHKLAGYPIEEPDVLLVDECHLFSNGAFAKQALRAFKSPVRIGFTATLPKDNIALHSIIGLLGEPINNVSTQQLIENDTLTECKVQIVPIHYSKEIIDKEYGKTYLDLYDEYIVHNSFRNELIKTICDLIPNNKTSKILILVQKLPHIEELKKVIPSIIALQGKDGNLIRKQEIENFINSDKKEILVGTKILETGVNIPQISHFINARGLKSEIATIQALGRTLRKFDSKSKVYVYDFLDKLKVLEVHGKKRITAYKKEKHDIVTLPGVNYVIPRRD